MNTSRRRFLEHAASGAAILPFIGSSLRAADAPSSSRGFAKGPSPMKIGLVTYNLANAWDIETIIKNCEAASFQGVELRTTHAHKVEVSLTPEQRKAVRKRFEDSKVELMGLGSAFDYHTPDSAKLKHDIAATQDYMLLARDVGASGVKVRPNGFPKDVAKEKTLEQIGKSLRTLGEFGEGIGIQIRLEVHGEGTSLLASIRTILDAADHRNVGITWNSNQSDLAGDGFDSNFESVKTKIFCVHMRDLYLEEYPFRKLLTRLTESGFKGYCLAEIPESQDPVRVMKYFRSLWLAYQGLL